jgi:uncharacterized protein YdbL (DUF1318 family)
MKRALSLLFFVSGCSGPLVGVNVNVIDEKTLLERQILGSYEELSKDLVMIASVRGVDDEGKIKPLPYLPPGKEKALRAAQSREFNRDDIEAFKAEGCAGENKEGYLSVLQCPRMAKDRKYSDFVTSIVKEENEDRRIVLQRTMETSENLEPKDLPKLERVFAQMNRDTAKPGELIQTDDGKWIPKK